MNFLQLQRMAFKSLLFSMLGLSAWQTALAQEPAQSSTLPMIVGKTLSGAPFSLAQHRGKVVLVVVWTTNCAPCRDMMRDLRENMKGLANKPFTTVLISVDKKFSDLQTYNQLINTMLPPSERLLKLWALDESYKDNLNTQEIVTENIPTDLPLIYVIDKQGKVQARHQMSLDAKNWKEIIALL